MEVVRKAVDSDDVIHTAWCTLAAFPVSNKRTLYSTVACPAIGYYVSRVVEHIAVCTKLNEPTASSPWLGVPE